MLSPLPYKDFTIKAHIDTCEVIEKKLNELNAEFIGDDYQIDHYFETTKGKLKWREAKIENLITHYERLDNSGVEQTVVYRYDSDPSQDQIAELKLHHKEIGITKKHRKIYNLGNLKIHLDRLPNDEEFIEIEAIDRDNQFSVDELKNQCLELKARLNIRDSDLIPTGYLKKIM